MRRAWALLALVLAACGGGNDTGGKRESGDPTAPWPETWVALEDQVLDAVNTQRALGAECAPGEHFDPVGPVVRNDRLRRAARAHSEDMFERDFFDHTNPGGESPWARIEDAGYDYSAAGENIAAGQATPEEVMDDWMHSPGHCENIMSPEFTELGVGYFFSGKGEYKHFWTQDFGRPL